MADANWEADGRADGRKLVIGLDTLGDHRAAGDSREVDEACDDGLATPGRD